MWAAVGSPLAALDHHLLTAHMAQHLLLMTVAAPLILLGAPAHRVAMRRIDSPGSFAGSPAPATVIAWHVPALFELGMRSARWHAFEHASFFAAGTLVLVARDPALAEPRENRALGHPVYLFLATLPATRFRHFLRFVTALSTRIICPRIGSSIFRLSGPGVRGRADVGLGHVCLSGSGGCNHNPVALAAAGCSGRPGSGKVVAIEVHHLVPRSHEVLHKRLLRVVTCIDFRDCPELGVRTEDKVDTGAGPLDFARRAIAPLKHAFGSKRAATSYSCRAG